jgi:peptidoglycan/LPS O-acetylase OafA/YrhL
VARLVAISLAGLLWVALVGAGVIHWPWASTWLPGHLTWFAVGMGLAVLEGVPHARSRASQNLRDLAGSPSAILLLVLAAFWLVSTDLGGPVDLGPTTASQAVAKEVLYAVIGGLLVVAGAFAPADGSWPRVLGGRVGRWSGRLSYAVFLWHLVVLAGVMRLLGLADFSGGFVVVTSLTLLGSIAVAAASWFVVERPSLVHVNGRSP